MAVVLNGQFVFFLIRVSMCQFLAGEISQLQTAHCPLSAVVLK